ncbi:response regulator transcription factor [Bacillus sp. JJ1562]|uniref:response regulator transcription factor n=1 Tax=Bacillus sp. JJ1562 TaxID=3122960 RepID=UPI003001CDA7
MYEVVLVDDDVIVIEFLKRFIPWEDYGFKVVGHFQDSSLALAYLTKNAYDVLITDIGMPKLNGIELIEQLKESKINSPNIILSCHDEFHYAQQALKLEVYDYILKETMEESNIIALLERLKEKLDQEHFTNNQHLIMTHFLEKNHLTLKSKFIEKLMKEQNVEKTVWFKEQEELLGMDFSIEQYTPVLCFIDQYQDTIQYYENETLLQFGLNNLLEEVLVEMLPEVQIFFMQGEFFMLFQTNKTMDKQRTIESIIKEIHNKIRTLLKISITSCLGEQNVQGQELIENMRVLLNAKEHRLYYQYDSIQYYRPVLYTSDSIFKDYIEVSQKIKELILKDEKAQLVAFLSEQLNLKREKNYSPQVIKDWVMKLITDVKLYVNALKYFEAQSNEKIAAAIQDVETFEHLESVLEDIFNSLRKQIQSINLTTRNEDILKAQKYVQIHLSEKISLTDVAEHLHLNPSYFSRMYKKETGEGFVEYVTKMKMVKAMELLDHSTKSVVDIAFELGFESKSYFLKTFKKYYGLSPMSYRFKDKETV